MSRRLWRPNAIRWALGISVLAVSATWLLSTARLGPEETERQKACEFWGITYPNVLAKCRQSAEQEFAAIAPLKRSAIEREIAEFNRQLSSSRKTQAKETSYPNWNMEEAAKMTGSLVGFIVGPIDRATFPAKGWSARLVGIVVTHDPDSEDGVPRYFTLEPVMPQDFSQMGIDDKNIREWAMRPTLNLDIESLNRHERQFIIDRCHFQSATPCRATVLGHIDEIVGRGDGWITYTGSRQELFPDSR
jgi:hypothetical protein